MSRDEFIGVLRQMFVEVENLSIKSQLYWGILVEAGMDREQLKKMKTAALADPALRQEANHEFAAMWQSIEDAGKDALFEELLDKLPPTDKPN